MTLTVHFQWPELRAMEWLEVRASSTQAGRGSVGLAFEVNESASLLRDGGMGIAEGQHTYFRGQSAQGKHRLRQAMPSTAVA